MNQTLINAYLKHLDQLRHTSGSQNETILREAFKDLLKNWGRQLDLVFVAEYPLKTTFKTNISVDGALLQELRLPLGFWEAKDVGDDLDAEVRNKFAKGYPQDNILFTNDQTAILWQNREEVARCSMTDPAALEPLITRFFAFERPEIASFRAAVAQFKTDLPAVLEALRGMIDAQLLENSGFNTAAAAFLAQAQEAINPSLTEADVREMLIQHILTEDIFARVFDDSDFHRHNNIARALYELEEKFFVGAVKKSTLKGLEPYYAAIRIAASQIASHHEKQTFLKVIYENFYKVYNPKAADRLGVVYTPNEIVRFMINSADWMCEQHFGRCLIDPNVEILDPCTGTGTYICELLEHFRGQPAKLKHKYLYELHANEAAILPYYVANLNIEATYAAISGDYADFANLCFVDTLDNVGLHTQATGSTNDLFGSMSQENMARIKRQNAKKISVIIGNPPYNANQANENDNNKNRVYPAIDERIKKTYIAASTAQKTKLYDMYARFFRWASDRLSDDGILAFITNRSFIDSRTFDGFRKMVAEEFNECWIVDLGGDWKKSGEIYASGGNVFGIGTGVAIAFWVKTSAKKKTPPRIRYCPVGKFATTAEDKLTWLAQNAISDIAFDHIRPDERNNWINQADNDFDTLIPIASKAIKSNTTTIKQQVIFKLFSLGVATNRDEWIYDFNKENLLRKVFYFIEKFNSQLAKGIENSSNFDYSIKWSSTLKQVKNHIEKDKTKVSVSMYRPFVKKFFYKDKNLSDRLTSFHFKFFGIELNKENPSITVMGDSSGKPYFTLTINSVPDLNFVSPASGGTQTLPLYQFDESGNRIDNITDWALKQFTAHYKPEIGTGKVARKIDKSAIFHYCYAVLHDPNYREKYALNLKRDFPRIPFYVNFWQWADWGKTLMELHIGFETVEPYPLTRTDIPDDKARAAGLLPKPLLRAKRDEGVIVLDSETTLSDIPPVVWEYRLGNRSALEWILDQYKEKTPKDPTIREQFNTYRFADYKEQVVDLLQRVTTVSVETMRIVEGMRR